MNNKQLVAKLLEEQSSGSDRDNDVVIGKMRAVTGNLFKRYNVPEFDYQSELETLSHALSDEDNYIKARNLVGKSVDFTDDDRVDRPVIIGAFALALGNNIRIGGNIDNPFIVQYIEKDFAAKSGISNFEMVDGLGSWVVVGKSSSYWDGYGGIDVEKQINLNRTSNANREEIHSGSKGIETTAKKMKSITQQYLSDDYFANDRKLLHGWARNVLREKGVSNRGNYMKVFADKLTDKNVVRYMKDPLYLKHERIDSREWLQVPGRILDYGIGDCDDLSLCIGLLAGLSGLGLTYRVAGCAPKKPKAYSHVYDIIHYGNSGGVDGFTGSKDVVIDIVYQKRGGTFGKEPKKFKFFDTRVL